MKNVKGTLILLLCSVIWGFSFVVQTMVVGGVGTFTFVSARCALASVSLLLIIAVRRAAGKRPESSKDPAVRAKIWRRSVLLGGFLFLGMIFQQLGIAAYPPEAASAGRAGFLTATNVVMVAVCGRIAGKKLHPLVVAAVAVTLAGMYFLCLGGGVSGIYTGDVFILLCALAYTGHIVLTGYCGEMDSLLVSCIQFGVSAALSAVVAFLFEDPQWSGIIGSAWAILYCGLLCNSFGNTMQIVGQRYADSPVAAIAMSPESVFGALGGWIVLGERLSGRELLGCALVFLAVLMAQTPDLLKKPPRAAS